MFLKQTKKRLSLKAQFKTEFLLPFTGSRKVLEKMPERLNMFKATEIERKIREINLLMNMQINLFP